MVNMLKYKENDLVSARISPKEAELIEDLVEEGLYMNTADFVRMAVREKLESIKIVDIRNINKDNAKKEIIEFLKDNGNCYPSDVADALRLDFDIVIEIIKELMKEGRIK